MKFNFNGLYNIYIDAINNNERTLVFQINNGNGKFVFMMFFDENDDDSKDTLFIYLRTLNFLVKLKMYGNHQNGIFDIYINEYIKNKMIEELQLRNNGGSFSFKNFLESLNSQVPHILHRKSKINKLREVWNNIDKDIRNSIVDESDKTILKGIVRLPYNKRPQEKTLRKLYLYIDANSSDVSDFIDKLKKRNITTSWTNDPNFGITFADAIIKLD